jgi:acetyltransferase-like isoleucine patch superfamily enzyme
MNIGLNVVIRFPINLRSPHNIYIADDAVIGEYAFLVASPNATIKIGHDTLLAPNVHINTTRHNYDNIGIPIRLQGSTEENVVIEADCWLGTGVIVCQGITIGKGAIVGANSVVLDDVMPYTVVGGSPAKFIKSRLKD